ncbi:MAG: hypothetical protein ABFD50_22625 [Smithella sp.]
MLKIIKKVMIIFVLIIFITVPVAAVAEEQKPQEQKPQPVQKVEDEKVSGVVDVSVLSAYILRGYEQTRNSIVIQPAATLNYKGFSASIWGNLDTQPYAADNANYTSKYTETDYILSYSKKFGILQVAPGYVYYALGAPNSGAIAPPDAQEVFLTLGLDTILSPTFIAYKEIDHYHYWYFQFGISHTFALHERVGLKLSATAGYLKSDDINENGMYAKYDSNSQATTDKYNNFHDGTLSVNLPIAITKSLTVIPTVSYVFPLCDDARYEMKAFNKKGTVASDRDSTYLYGGLTLNFAF